MTMTDSLPSHNSNDGGVALGSPSQSLGEDA